MIDVYVINLDSRQDRFNKISKNLDFLCVKYHRISAVNGKRINEADYKGIFNKFRFRVENNREITPGEMGCTLSHIKTWKEFLNSGKEFAIVLEDDVEVTPEIKTLVNSKIYKNFDYLKIDSSNLEQKQSIRAIENKIYFKTFQMDGITAFSCHPVPYSMAGYIIKRNCADRFIKKAKNLYFPIDIFPRYVCNDLNKGFVKNKIVTHIDTQDTDIPGRVFRPNISLGYRVLFTIHSIFSLKAKTKIYYKFRKALERV